VDIVKIAINYQRQLGRKLFCLAKFTDNIKESFITEKDSFHCESFVHEKLPFPVIEIFYV